MEFFGLLHVADDHRSSPNLKGGGGRGNPTATYFADAVTLSKSLECAGCRFTLLTNDRMRLEALNAATVQAEIAMREIPFALDVPGDIPYYSAHHKIDVYRWFAGGAGGGYPVLLDLDVVALKPPPTQFLACAAAGVPMVYDISDHVFLLSGEARVAADIGRLAGPDVPIGHWYGGEFMAGPPGFFARLADQVERVWSHYRRHFASFRHQGDETPTSAALCRMLTQGHVFIDGGPIGGIGRFGSWLPLHPQKPFWWFEQCFLVHLPSDKYFLAAQATRPFEVASFLRRYRRHIVLRRARGQLHRLAKVALRQRRHFSARRECESRRRKAVVEL